MVPAAERGTGWSTVLRQGVTSRKVWAGWNEDRRIILKWIFRKWDVDGAWTGLSWLRIGTGCGQF